MPTSDQGTVSFAVVDSRNALVLSVGRTDMESLSSVAGDNDVVAPIPDGVAAQTHRYDWHAHEFVSLPQKPGPWAEWDGTRWTDHRTPAQIAGIAAAELAAKWAVLRQERDHLLALCDWTQVPDVPLTVTQKLAWQSYRCALRDMPEKTTDPAKPVWPTPPKS